MKRNTLTRRAFFQTILAAIAAQNLLVSPAVADAIAQYPEDDVSILIRRARQCVTASTAEEKASLFERTIAFGNERFDPCALDTGEVQAVLYSPEDVGFRNGDLLDESVLRTLVRGVVFVAVAITLVRQSVSSRDGSKRGFSCKSDSWKVFSDNYASVLLDTRVTFKESVGLREPV